MAQGNQGKEHSRRSPWWKRLWGWTGFGEKKLWDWLQLLSALAIPVVLTVAGFWFAAQQEEREAKPAELERELEAQRSQDEALQTYFDQMTQLMLERNLRDSEEGSEMRTLARARTLAVLRRLDSDRKRSLLLFLYEAKLINKEEPVVNLAEADFANTDLSGVSLSDANLDGANLAKSDLRSAGLNGADLRYASLQDAKLTYARLQGAVLTGAGLGSTKSVIYFPGMEADGKGGIGGADLSGADLTGADLKNADMNNIDMSTLSIPSISFIRRTRLTDADLSRAFLLESDLRGVILNEADLSGAILDATNLGDAHLGGADLSRTSLWEAKITQDQLDACASLEGATMPTGQKYEDWLKDQEGSEEDGAEDKKARR